MSKPWYQSQTIISASTEFAILAITILVGLWDPETERLRAPNGIEMGLLSAGFIALDKAIAGRKKAVESIGPEDSTNISYSTLTPDFSAIAELPSAEDASIVPDTPVLTIDEADAIDSDEDDLEIDLEKLKGSYYLVATQDTKLKTSVQQSSELSSDAWMDVFEGQTIYIDAWNYLGQKNDHIAVKIDEYNNINGGDFFVYAPHFDLFSVLGNKVPIKAASSPTPIIDKKLTPINLPGYSSTFFLENSIYDGSHFSWAEATRNGTRMPSEKRQVDNIIAVAHMLDKARAFNGNRPMVITSWLRPPHINRQVGGVANSRHITGDGVDFAIPGANMYDVQEKMKAFCRQHNLGLGLGARRGFVHLDMSPSGHRVWNY